MRTRLALPLILLISACASDPEPNEAIVGRTYDREELRAAEAQRDASGGESAPQIRRASEAVPGYDGQPQVERVGEDPKARLERQIEEQRLAKERAVESLKSARFIVYVTEEVVRAPTRAGMAAQSDQRRSKSIVITDANAYDFKLAYKTTDYRELRGAVKTVSPEFFNSFYQGLAKLGIGSLRGRDAPIGEEAVSKSVRAIHIQIDGQRRAIIKADQPATGGISSPRSIFTLCEHELIKLLAPPQRELSKE